MKKIALITAILILAGCTIHKELKTPFNDSEYQAYDKQGNSAIVGQAFLKTIGGEVRYGAGETVSLIPATAYSEEVVGFNQYTYIRPSNVDSRFQSHIRTTTADASGNFEFHNIPAGEYFVQCPIYWSTDGYDQVGSTVTARFKVNEGRKIKVILTE